METIADSICKKLGITHEQFNSLYISLRVEGEAGKRVSKEIATRFSLDEEKALGEQLHALGILTEEEVRYFDDKD
jgi:hypothetical protein